MPLQSFLKVSIKSELYSVIIAHDQKISLLGETVVRDTPMRMYIYDETSVLTPDGESIIRPTAIAMGSPGRYIKQNIAVPAVGTVTSIAVASTDITVTGSPITSSGTIALALSNTGVTAGVYGLVTVNAKGLVTAGKRQELYSGTTNAAGTYTVVFGTPYSVAPNIQANIVNQSNVNQSIRITNISTTGFTVNVYQRNSVNLLGIEVLLAATVNVTGAAVDVIVTEK